MIDRIAPQRQEFTATGAGAIIELGGACKNFALQVVGFPVGATDVSLTATVNFKARAQNINSGGANAQNLLQAKVITINRLGLEKTTSVKRHYDAAGSNLLKFGPGFLHSLVVNSPGITGSNIAVYDSTSTLAGNIVANIDTAKTSIGTLTYDVPFDNGLFIVRTGTIGDITVVYE